MEIIHLILGKANPNRMNGVNKVVHQLVTQQKHAGLNVSVWGITSSPVHDYPPRNFETRLFTACRNRFRIDPELENAILNLHGQYVFHFHGGFHPVFHTVAGILKKKGFPYILTPHGAYNEVAMKKSWLTKMLYIQLFEKDLIRSASAVHCLGHSEVTGARSVYPRLRHRLIPYGVDKTDTYASIPDYYRFIMGFCGRIDIHTKGLDAIVNSFALVREKIPQAELWIIGDSKERPALENMIASLGLKNVQLWGSKYGHEKEDLLRQMHVFLHPSRNEGLPSAVLEAASLGIPCVVTTATNVGESILRHRCGAVIRDTDPLLLAEAVLSVYNTIRTQGWKKISDASRRMVSEEYNWNRILGLFDDMYKEAVLA